jgi:hypothetical protein
MNKISLITTFTFVLLGFPGICQGKTWRQADIYYVNWDIETRTLLSPENVRKQGLKFHFSSQKEVNRFIKLLEIQKLKSEGEPGFPFPENARLVIDLIGDDGKQTTYYASRNNLCNHDCSLKHPINEVFRARFRNLAKNTKG